MFTGLPASLVALILAYPVLSASNSLNDPFKAISAHVTREPEPPVCCLTPLPPDDPVEDELLLSFEEWKEKQATAGKEKDSPNRTNSPSAQNPAGELSHHASNNISLTSTELLDPSSDPDSTSFSPHFQVPLKDRFNYASMDCSARVHQAHRSAKSPSEILSRKRDRYMLSPCSSPKENQFVVVELCEDIRIDTVQLANFEFFSGVFKDFTVSVSRTNKDDWVEAGTYRAQNVRGVQSFHPPPTLTGFYRFIRIDFHTHYSNEYYCPISLLRVYGLTHLEEWKWEIWAAESKAKRGESVEPSVSEETVAEEPVTVHTLSPDVTVDSPSTHLSDHSLELETTKEAPAITSVGSSTPVSQSTLAPFAWEQFTATSANEAQSTLDHHRNELSTLPPTTIMTAIPSPSTLPSASNTSTSIAALNTTTTQISSVSSSSLPSSLPVVSATPQIHSPPPAAGGESIYRIIMNRLTALEANNTLHVRYVEQQANGVREVIRRMSEDVGRLDGIVKAQSQKFQRSLNEWENQRKLLETEYDELVARIEYLSDEIVHEKRLSIAQLCLLLAVIVFMGLTRGSRGESLVEHGPLRFRGSMREWSRRHLNFSGDWGIGRFTANSSRSRSRSSSLQRTAKSPSQEFSKQDHRDDDHKVAFPALSARPRGLKSAAYAKPHLMASDRKPKIQNFYLPSSSRPRTPSFRTPHPHSSRHASRPTTPTTAITTTYRPQMQRANSLGSPTAEIPMSASWSGVGPVPKSAKQRGARTAHLHEVKNPVLDNKIVKVVETRDDEKENAKVASTSDDVEKRCHQSKKLNDDADQDVFHPETPSRGSKQPNGHSMLITPETLAKSSLDLHRRWSSSPGDGEDGDSWVDTDDTTDGYGTSTDDAEDL